MGRSDERPDDDAEEVIDELRDNIRRDREGLLSVLSTLKSSIGDSVEMTLLAAEHLIKGYDVLNKINAQLTDVAEIVIKRSDVDKEDPMEGAWDEIEKGSALSGSGPKREN
jgi:hypothetical protein